MMKPHFGPSEHIRVGLRELQKYFDIELLVLGKYEEPVEKPGIRSFTKGRAVGNGFVGLLRDVKLLLQSNRGKKKLREILRHKRLDFIYERGQYLDLRGVCAAKELGIKHFYEVNWLNFLGIQQFYRSWFNSTARRIEEYSYRKSTLNFFIGTQHKLISIPDNKVSIIQNGIHEALLHQHRDRINSVEGKIKICFVANLMPHHRFDLLVQALKINPLLADKYELHTVGYNFEEQLHELPGNLRVFSHGPTKKEDLPGILSACNIGLITGGPSYSSFMKLFEYAAFKHCVVCPDLENIRLMFDKSEIAYFDTDNAASLAGTLKQISENPSMMQQSGVNIYNKVLQQFTWERIYESVSKQISKAVPV